MNKLKYIIIIFILLIFISNLSCNQKQQEFQENLILMNKSYIRPDDGDSFYYKDIVIRVLGMDTPEIIHKEHGIFMNQPYGLQAAQTTRVILTNAKVIQYLPVKKDKYGRVLAHVFVDGELLSVLLIKAGLAYETISFYGDNGYPKLANRILKAARNSPEPLFENPHNWRRKHQANPVR